MDSTHSIVAAIQGACADLDLPIPSRREASWVIGLSLQSALYHCVPTLTEERMGEFLDRFRFHFLSLDPHIKLFDGVTDLWGELVQRQVSLGVATGKNRVGLDRALDAMQLRPYFAATR